VCYDALKKTRMCEKEPRRLNQVQENAVRAEVSHLLESPAFRTSKRCREFLEYVIEHTIDLSSGALKERSLGVALFQLPQDFDTGEHTIVRVTANEVRKKLAQHYLAENGSSHVVRIDLPPGSYAAEFRWENLPVDPIPAATESAGAQAAERTAIETPGPGEQTAGAAGQTPEFGTHTAPGNGPWALPAVAHGPVHANWRSYLAIAGTAVLIAAGAISLWRWQVGKTTSVNAKSTPVSITTPIGAAAVASVRMIAGSGDSYVDRSGKKWGPDRFYSGGNTIVHPSERIFRTLDPDIYRHLRTGDFRYDIPLPPGNYELHLHFAETGLGDFISAESSGEGQRLFRVYVNGNRILGGFDVVADAAGSNIADERVFRNISPAEDGFLHLTFASLRSTAMLSGIEVLPVSVGKVQPVRIRSGWASSWQDSAGQQWQSDSYFLGGNALVRTTNPAQENNSIAPEMALYASERWGHFSYAVPVADGRYRVTLKFCEGHYGKRNSGGGGPGSRVFDVYCNGVALLRDFDIIKEADGEGRPVDRTFAAIRPNAQGKILLTFVPVVGMACVNGIEVVEDAR
jgi:malectin (di-glucose binding ER protein)